MEASLILSNLTNAFQFNGFGRHLCDIDIYTQNIVERAELVLVVLTILLYFKILSFL